MQMIYNNMTNIHRHTVIYQFSYNLLSAVAELDPGNHPLVMFPLVYNQLFKGHFRFSDLDL